MPSHQVRGTPSCTSCTYPCCNTRMKSSCTWRNKSGRVKGSSVIAASHARCAARTRTRRPCGHALHCVQAPLQTEMNQPWVFGGNEEWRIFFGAACARTRWRLAGGMPEACGPPSRIVAVVRGGARRWLCLAELPTDRHGANQAVSHRHPSTMR